MNSKQYGLMLVTVAIAGLIGGGVSSQFFMAHPMFAQKTPDHAKVIKAERFELVDKEGKPSAVFGVAPDGRGPFLAFMTRDGKTSVMLSSEAPFLGLYQNGEPRIALAVNSDGVANLNFFGNQQVRLSLNTQADGSPGLFLFDKDGENRARFYVLQDGKPNLVFYDGRLVPRALLGVLLHGHPGMMLFDKHEKVSAVLILKPNGRPSLALYDENGKVIGSVP